MRADAKRVLLVFKRTKFTVASVKIDKRILKEICFRKDLFPMLDTLDEAFDIVVVAKTHSVELRLQ
jgi:hypothetical protein